MDRILIEKLKANAVIGIWEWEKQITQIVEIDIEFSIDARIITKDNISETTNYKDVAKDIKLLCESRPFELVETMAEEIAKFAIAKYKMKKIMVKVCKPGALSDAKNVGIQIERSLSDYDL
ncbi:MAG: dihydroneopterin aldolase [Gammaproteobacteria bacterium]|jgi:dihydroneopterin aldolase